MPHLSTPQEWFSSHKSEPSRQVLVDLVKAHNRVESDESNGAKTRSRGSTMTSTEWQRGRSRAESLSDDAWSKPASPYHVRQGSTCSTRDRSEGATKALLAKGGLMLRRTGSKISMSSAGSSSTLGLTSPPRTTNVSVPNAPTRSEELRSKTSTSFDVSQTEPTQFAGLGRIEEAGLADQFTDVVTKQSAAPGLRGIEASDIGTTEEPHRALAINSRWSDLDPPSPQLPMTPPRPTPPPKDETVENYIGTRASPEKPTDTSQQLSPPTAGFSPQTLFATVDVALAGTEKSTRLASAATDDINLNAKPLPELVDTQTKIPIIHAVITEDNIARPMKAAPLPADIAHIRRKLLHPKGPASTSEVFCCTSSSYFVVSIV